ncbi:Protein YIP4 [Aduncisulcus paluster]|uniref:Protein YIPF n=1 Tax=Aduncisulcus paluster TaxID=2918883 RepID=A0ABQ5JT70_9EUKA|nr:Protein YIP4 [Aduncisulcus paluster]
MDNEPHFEVDVDDNPPPPPPPPHSMTQEAPPSIPPKEPISSLPKPPVEDTPKKPSPEAEPVPLVPIPTNTLDESVWVTFYRDIKVIGHKLAHVLWPPLKGDSLREEWDLWGPLIFSLLFAVVLAISEGGDEGHNYNAFSFGFFIIWAAAIIITANAILIGGEIGFLQTVCLLGYCLAPVSFAALLCLFWNNFIYRTVIIGVMTVYSVWASWGFITGSVIDGKKFEAIYPVGLLYTALGWIVFIMGN